MACPKTLNGMMIGLIAKFAFNNADNFTVMNGWVGFIISCFRPSLKQAWDVIHRLPLGPRRCEGCFVEVRLYNAYLALIFGLVY